MFWIWENIDYLRYNRYTREWVRDNMQPRETLLFSNQDLKVEKEKSKDFSVQIDAMDEEESAKLGGSISWITLMKIACMAISKWQSAVVKISCNVPKLIRKEKKWY